MKTKDWIERNHKYTLIDSESGFSLRFAGMNFEEEDLGALREPLKLAYAEMQKIEAGEIKNPDENRKVTHFTDRSIYPGSTLYGEVEEFAKKLREGAIKGSTGAKFSAAVINGIGGSALGPQLLQFAIRGPYWNELSDEARGGNLKLYFTDNTDSAGVVDILSVVDLESTLIVTVSKSGGTQETKNNLRAFELEFEKKGLDFAKHACAVTMDGSSLHERAQGDGWLAVFEMAESIGGRTSETNIVGHVPAALTGVNFKALLDGALRMDELTREKDFSRNPAYMLAAMWHIAGGGKGDRNMVIVPYSDRLVLLSRYLQQLVMESLGKERDLDGRVVHQGLNVFGNKGGTDAHAFIQQLNDGRDDFFVTFIEVLRDAKTFAMDDGVTMGDYLHGFQCGLSEALRNKERQVIQMSVERVDEYNLGMLIALYERAVAVYAELIHVNAFHQPGVQAYKLASKSIIEMMLTMESSLAELADFTGSAEEIAAKMGMERKEVEVAGVLNKFAVNGDQRTFNGFAISRKWSKDCGWSYHIEKR